MSLYVPFVESAIVFIENGQMSHFQSWILFAVYFVLLSSMLVKLFVDPNSMGPFWFSFRVNIVILHHFYFYLAAVSVVVVLLTQMAQTPYVAVVPFGLMCVYTLFFRPFKQFHNNLHSAFNYCAISVFVFFNFFVLKTQRREINYEKVFVFLFVCFAVLFVSAFASVLSMVSHYRRVYVTLPKLKELERERKRKENEVLSRLAQANVLEAAKKSQEKNFFLRNIVCQKDRIVDYSDRLLLQKKESECDNQIPIQKIDSIEKYEKMRMHIKEVRKEVMLKYKDYSQKQKLREKGGLLK